MSDLAITASVVEGPYFRLGAPRRYSLIEPGITGERLLLTGLVLNTHGRPIPGAVLQFWTSDDKGNYDMVGYQLHGYRLADERGIQVQESPDGGKTGTLDFVIQQVNEKDNVTAESRAARTTSCRIRKPECWCFSTSAGSHTLCPARRTSTDWRKSIRK